MYLIPILQYQSHKCQNGVGEKVKTIIKPQVFCLPFPLGFFALWVVFLSYFFLFGVGFVLACFEKRRRGVGWRNEGLAGKRKPILPLEVEVGRGSTVVGKGESKRTKKEEEDLLFYGLVHHIHPNKARHGTKIHTVCCTVTVLHVR